MRSMDPRRSVLVGTAVSAFIYWMLATSAQPWRLFERGPYSSNFYDAQARSLIHLHLDVPSSIATIEGFLVGGKTHIYFGLGPALLRLPSAAISDFFDGRLTLLSQLVALCVLGISAGHLLSRSALLVAPDHQIPVFIYGAFAASATLATPVLFLASRSWVYHEAVLWGCATAVAGINLIASWWHEHRRGAYIAVVAITAFALSCRASSGSIPAICLLILALVACRRKQWATASRAALAVVPAGIAYIGVNYARFGTAVSVPWSKQTLSGVDPNREAAMAANNGELFNLEFLPTTTLHYFSPSALQPSRLFPFITWGNPAKVIGDVTFDIIGEAGSITTGAPVLFALTLLGGWWILRRDRGWMFRAALIASAIATLPMLALGFILHRYLVDLVPVVIVAAAPGTILAFVHRARLSVAARRAATVLVAGVAIVAMFGQVSLALQARYLLFLPTSEERRDFTSLQIEIHETMFGEIPANVSGADGDLPAPAVDAIVVLDHCAGLYRSDGHTWFALEHQAGAGRRLVLEGDIPTTTSPIAAGTDWALRVEPRGDEFVVVYTSPGLPDFVSDHFTATGDSLVLDIVADPSTAELLVRAGDELILDGWLLPNRGLTPVEGWRQLSGRASLCMRLDRILVG